jgi:hypothetical protein
MRGGRTVDRDGLAADRVGVRVRASARETVEHSARNGNNGVSLSIEHTAGSETRGVECAWQQGLVSARYPCLSFSHSPSPTPWATTLAAAATRETIVARKNIFARRVGKREVAPGLEGESER